ncbi:unnamed protein product [Urochloa decumbens]|uniref:Uncharacterized protein n=1 Tax=Urochloa decumbens TaxID=240449 RepID=A0ABC8XZ41_9POAL
MANGDVVLAAVGPGGGGGGMVVLRVNRATGELVRSSITGGLFDPLHGRDLPLLAEHAGRQADTILTEENAARAALLAAEAQRVHFALFLDSGPQVPRRGLDPLPQTLLLDAGGAAIPQLSTAMADGNIVLAAVGPGGGGGLLVLCVNWATGELVGSSIAAGLFDPLHGRNLPLLAEHAGRQATAILAEENAARAALLAADAGRVHFALILDTGPQVPRRGPDPILEAPLVDAGGAAPRGGGALVLAAGAAVPNRGLTLNGRLPEVLLHAGAGAPRGYLIADEQLLRALLSCDGLRIAAARAAHQVGLVAATNVLFHGGRDGLVASPGAGSLLPTPEAEERVVVRVFAADNNRIRGPRIAATEDPGLGRPLLAALLVSIHARGEQNAPEFVFEVEALQCGLSNATARGHCHFTDSEERVAVRLFVATNDGSHGPFIGDTGDLCFGRSLLAALVVSTGARSDRSVQIVFEVEVLRRGLSSAAAGDHRFEHVFGRGLLAAPRNARSHSHGLASRLSAPTLSNAASSRQAAAAAPPRRSAPALQPRGAAKGLKMGNMVAKRKGIQKRKVSMKLWSVEKVCIQKLTKFRSLLGDFVWFAVPSVLLFYPRRVEGNEAKDQTQDAQPHVALLQMISNIEDPSIEKKIVMASFVTFLSIWIMAYLLATLGRGKSCLRLVGILTYMSVISIIAFIDYMLFKDMPQNIFYEVLFILHFTIMACCISQVWRMFVRESTSQLPSFPKFQGLVHKMRTWRRQPTTPLQENNHLGEDNSLLTPLLPNDEKV